MKKKQVKFEDMDLECPECGDDLKYAEQGMFFYCRNKQCPFTADADMEIIAPLLARERGDTQ